MKVSADPGSEEGDFFFTALYTVKNGKLVVIDNFEHNEIKMLRLFKLLCSGKDYINQRILVRNLIIPEKEALLIVDVLVGKHKLKRKFIKNTCSLFRGDKLFD